MSKSGRYSADRKKIEAIESAAKTVEVSDCGTIFTLDLETSAMAVTMPNCSAAGNGWWCKFIVRGNPRTGDYVITGSGDASEGVDGGRFIAATMYASGSGAKVDGGCPTPVTAGSGSNFDTITINKNIAVPGDQIELVCDGNNWYATVLSFASDGVTLT